MLHFLISNAFVLKFIFQRYQVKICKNTSVQKCILISFLFKPFKEEKFRGKKQFINKK